MPGSAEGRGLREGTALRGQRWPWRPRSPLRDGGPHDPPHGGGDTPVPARGSPGVRHRPRLVLFSVTTCGSGLGRATALWSRYVSPPSSAQPASPSEKNFKSRNFPLTAPPHQSSTNSSFPDGGKIHPKRQLSLQPSFPLTVKVRD